MDWFYYTSKMPVCRLREVCDGCRTCLEHDDKLAHAYYRAMDSFPW